VDNLTQSTFRQRCASALTHPVTAGALGVLLLNDLVFKALCPIRGRRGSSATWRGWCSRRRSGLAAVAGGPGEPTGAAGGVDCGLHRAAAAVRGVQHFPWCPRCSPEWVFVGIGSTAGSPLDPTDSLVIPVGLGIALWVWRRGAVAPGDLRRRLTALTAGVAVVASVATSMAEPGYGVTHIWTVEPSAVIASDGISAAPYESLDGGFTWRPGTTGPTSGGPGSAAEAVTPRGTYVLGDTAIVLVKSSDDVQEVYSTDYLQGAANEWVQRRQTEHLGGTRVTTQPHSSTTNNPETW
jgi:hypothetical protein